MSQEAPKCHDTRRVADGTHAAALAESESDSGAKTSPDDIPEIQ
jgi:hypothetical protein